MGKLRSNPTAQIPWPKQKHYERARYLDLAQIEALLAAINPQDSPLGRRDYALILGQVTSPLRPDELRLLHWGQLELGGETARVRIPAQLRLGRWWIRAVHERLKDDLSPTMPRGRRGKGGGRRLDNRDAAGAGGRGDPRLAEGFRAAGGDRGGGLHLHPTSGAALERNCAAGACGLGWEQSDQRKHPLRLPA